MKNYGKELILDVHDCNPELFTRTCIEDFFIDLCKEIDMEKCDHHFWDYAGYPEEYEKAPDHLKGISAVCFIKTSNIMIHTLDVLKVAYINIFSCKDFNVLDAANFTAEYFEGKIRNYKTVDRI